MKCQLHESRLISINEDEGKSTRAGVSEVDEINRNQPWSIALKPSIRLETECSPVNRWVARLPAKQALYLVIVWLRWRSLLSRVVKKLERLEMA